MSSFLFFIVFFMIYYGYSLTIVRDSVCIPNLFSSTAEAKGDITKTCPCSMKQFIKVEKMIFLDTFFLFLLKT